MASIKIQCPNCNKGFEIEGDRELVFCSYCGNRIEVNTPIIEDNVQKLTIDIRNDLELEKYRYPIVEKRLGSSHVALWIMGVVIVIIVLVFVILFGRTGNTLNISASVEESAEATVLYSSNYYERNVTYQDAVEELEGLGFINIKLKTYAHPTVKIMGLEDKVYDIKINGNSLKSGKSYPINSEIVITYYVSNLM